MTKNQIKFAREVLDEYPSEKEVYSFADGNVFLANAKTHALNHARSTGKQFSLIRRDEIEALEVAAEAAEKAAAEAAEKAAEKAAAEAAEKAAAEAAEKAAAEAAKKAAAEAAEKAAAEAAEKAAAEAAEKAAAEATFKAKLAAKEADEKAAKEKAGKAAKKTDKEVEQPKAPTSPVAEPEKTGSIDDIINHAD
jgi:membrane protein involved in colicin uptake